jgi:hypothetical protein
MYMFARVRHVYWESWLLVLVVGCSSMVPDVSALRA